MPCSHIRQLPEPACWFSSTIGDTEVPTAKLLALLAVPAERVARSGPVVSSAPRLAPSSRNCTPPTPAEALAVTPIVPPTGAPEAGDVILTVGAAAAAEEATPRN